MSWKDILVVMITSLSVLYISMYTTILAFMDPKAIMYNLVWCISIVWTLLFIYANVRKGKKKK